MTATDNHSFSSLWSERSRWARGPAIGRLMRQALRFPDLISLAAGFVDNATLPCEATAKCMDQLSSHPEQLRGALQYDATAGSVALRDRLCHWSYRDYPEARPTPERVILTAGSNQFLHLLSESIVDPGDIVLVAAPTYFVYLGMLDGIGARVMGVPADADGMCMQALQEQLDQLACNGQAERVKAVYAVTEFDNPSGSTLSVERRRQLLDIVTRWRHAHGPLLVFSDNAYRELRYSGEDLPPLTALDASAQDFVVELGTFSKSFSPGIRVGWGVVPDTLVEPLLDMKSNIDFGSPHFSQALMLNAIESGEIDRHLPQIRQRYTVKLQAMLEALQAQFGESEDVEWRKPSGGLYVWLTLPDHIDTSEAGHLWAGALERGVLYVPGHYCFAGDAASTPRNTIRLSFGVQTPDRIREGIKLLAEAYASASRVVPA